MPIPSRRPRLSSILAAIALTLLLVAPVRAHAELETATPGPGATVEGSPPELLLTFTEPLDPESTSIVLVDADGDEVATGGELGDAPDQWRLPLPELAPSVYEVRWTASSTVDAHLERGTYRFTVVAAPTPSPTARPSPTPEPSPRATATPSPTATPTPTPTPSSAPSAVEQPPSDPVGSSVLLPIVAVLVLVAALGAWLIRRRGP
jgi:methionine-rich copper-binding protein CopC